MTVRSLFSRSSSTGRRRLAGLAAVGTAAALALTACGGSSDPLSGGGTSAASTTAASGSAGGGGGSLVIGSANFPESALLANIYAEALATNGVQATTNLNIGSREVYLKALEDGSINLVPEYTGVLLQYFDPSATAVSSDDVYAALQEKVPSDLQVLDKSPAEDKDAVVVTQDTASKYNLKSIADLKPVAGELILGGPPEWATRPTGVPGLQAKYGLTFKEFKPLDAGGPLTLNALLNDQIQAGNLFTTDPAIPANNLVVLEDPENLYAAENILPLIAKSKNSPVITDTLNEVSAKLTTEDLTALLARVTVDKEDSVAVAQDWVSKNLTSGGGGSGSSAATSTATSG